MFETVWQCPVCESPPDRHNVFTREPGNIWKNNKMELIPLFYGICMDCGTVFQMQRLKDPLSYYMQGDYRRTVQFGDPTPGDRIREEQEQRVKFLMPELAFESVKRVLDIGSSMGLFLEAMAEKYDCEVLGIEPGEAQRLLSKAPALSDITLLDDSVLESFDLITMIHSLEHMNEPTQYLLRLHDFITEDGHLLVEVPHLYHEISLLVSHPVAFTPESLDACLGLAGWEVVWSRVYNGFKSYPGNILVLAKPGNIKDSLPSVDIAETAARFNEGQEALRKFIEERRAKGAV